MRLNKIQAEQFAVVRFYILHRKGVEVTIQFNNPFCTMKLQEAYKFAFKWMQENGVEIKGI